MQVKLSINASHKSFELQASIYSDALLLEFLIRISREQIITKHLFYEVLAKRFSHLKLIDRRILSRELFASCRCWKFKVLSVVFIASNMEVYRSVSISWYQLTQLALLCKSLEFKKYSVIKPACGQKTKGDVTLVGPANQRFWSLYHLIGAPDQPSFSSTPCMLRAWASLAVMPMIHMLLILAQLGHNVNGYWLVTWLPSEARWRMH